MWHCLSCKSDVEDKYAYCWKCGKKRVLQTEPVIRRADPKFASFEQLVPEPASHQWIIRRGLMTRILSYAGVGVVFVILKILSSQFFGTYGLYIFIALALVVLVLILWRSFRRDKSDGVGINLH